MPGRFSHILLILQTAELGWKRQRTQHSTTKGEELMVFFFRCKARALISVCSMFATREGIKCLKVAQEYVYLGNFNEISSGFTLTVELRLTVLILMPNTHLISFSFARYLYISRKPQFTKSGSLIVRTEDMQNKHFISLRHENSGKFLKQQRNICGFNELPRFSSREGSPKPPTLAWTHQMKMTQNSFRKLFLVDALFRKEQKSPTIIFSQAFFENYNHKNSEKQYSGDQFWTNFNGQALQGQKVKHTTSSLNLDVLFPRQCQSVWVALKIHCRSFAHGCFQIGNAEWNTDLDSKEPRIHSRKKWPQTDNPFQFTLTKRYAVALCWDFSLHVELKSLPMR